MAKRNRERMQDPSFFPRFQNRSREKEGGHVTNHV